MFLTLISILFAGLAFIFSDSLNFKGHPLFIASMIGSIGTALWLVTPLTRMLFVNSLQKSHSFSLVRKDFLSTIRDWYLFCFILVSYGVAFLFLLVQFPYASELFALWIIALGLALEATFDGLRRSLKLLDPHFVVEELYVQAKHAIQTDKNPLLWDSMDQIAEVGLHSLDKDQLTLTLATINKIEPILRLFYASSKSVSRMVEDKKVEQATGTDETGFTLFHQLQRLQLINERALQRRIEPVVSRIIIVLGKVIIASAELDLSLITVPVNFLGKFAVRSQQMNMDEVALLATGTLIEVSKSILKNVDLTYAELVVPFQTIVANLDLIAKSTFRKEKKSSIKLLVEPIKELRTLFQEEKVSKYRDTPAVLENIDRTLAEYEALEQVLRTIPSGTTTQG